MLRIAKSTPGVLDLSAVKDEHGLPVTLIGPSHRDVPDHEENNPVLQRVRELHWVTVSKVPVETSDDSTLNALSSLEPTPDSPLVLDAQPQAELTPANDNPTPPAATADLTSVNGSSDAHSDSHASMTTNVTEVAPPPAVKSERKLSRRS